MSHFTPPDITKLRPQSDDPFIFNEEAMYLIRLGHFRALIKKLETDPFPVVADQLTIIGDGTIGSPLIAVAAAPALPRNAVHVDPVFGNDATGLTHRFDRPFKSMKAAEAVSVAGDTLIMGPGTYSGVDNALLGQPGRNYLFMDGAVSSNATGTATFTDLALVGGETFSVSGWGEFISNSYICFVGNSAINTVYFTSKKTKITAGDNGFYATNSGIVFLSFTEGEHAGANNNEPFVWAEDTAGGASVIHLNAKKLYRSTPNSGPLVRISANTTACRVYTTVDEMTNTEAFANVIEMVDGGYMEVNGRITFGSGRGVLVSNDLGGAGKLIVNGSIHSDDPNFGSIEISTSNIEVISNAFITGYGTITASVDQITLRILKDVIVDTAPLVGPGRSVITIGDTDTTLYTYNCTIQNLLNEDNAHTINLGGGNSTFICSGTTLLVNPANLNTFSIFTAALTTYVGKAMYTNRGLHADVTNLLPTGIEIIDSLIE